MWNEPCGDVSYAEAVVMVTELAKQHDALIKQLDDPKVAEKTRSKTEWRHLEEPAMKIADTLTDIGLSPDNMQGSMLLPAAQAGIRAADEHPEQSPATRLVAYQSIMAICFNDHVIAPSDLDEREEFDMVKRKLERRIADLAGNPNTISAVAERYYKNNQIKLGVLRKYRGNIRKLINSLGDIPISHINPAALRRFRDEQAATMQPSALAAVFTPIRGMFTYALEEELIATNPVQSVKLPKDKRSVHERKWTPFPPREVQRLLEAMEDFWGKPMRGLSNERRLAVHMVCRVMAHSAMRPVEVVRLEPEDVSDDWIKVRASKTPSSYRTIPLHPNIADFPAFIAKGGLQTFRNIKTDQVEPVRYNFRRLTRDLMDPPIKDEKKVVYSLRSTFSNAMRRAGARPDVRRAILGHAEGGHLSHYDDGPEFFLKRKWVNATDPTVIYPDTDDYYDDGLADN
jgi:integrase